MYDFDQAVGRIHRQWESTAAREIIHDLVTAIWQTGGPDDESQARAAVIRQMLKERLSAGAPPAERLDLLNLSYALEQGLGNRNEALDLAVQAEGLSRQAGTPIQRVRAVFQMAKALLYVDRNADAVRWTQQGLLLGDQLEQAAASGSEPSIGDAELKELRYLLADQESRLVNRMATLGEMDAEVDRAAGSAIARWEKMGDPVGMAAGLGMLVEARVFQGRWEDAARLARKALTAVEYPKKDPSIAYALCFGALALCRLGDPQTALSWTADAAGISQEVGNHECVLESGAVHAVALAALGRVQEAMPQIDQVVQETALLDMGTLTRWVVGLRAWLRMNAHLPTPPQELHEAYRYLSDAGYRLMAAELLYAESCALRLAGRGGQEELREAMAQFERFGMTWHMQMASCRALVG